MSGSNKGSTTGAVVCALREVFRDDGCGDDEVRKG